jgi:hypothetical protein
LIRSSEDVLSFYVVELMVLCCFFLFLLFLMSLVKRARPHFQHDSFQGEFLRAEQLVQVQTVLISGFMSTGMARKGFSSGRTGPAMRALSQEKHTDVEG